MNRKTHKPSANQADVVKAKKPSGDPAAHRLLLSSRPMVGHDITVSVPIENGGRIEPPSAPVLASSKRTVIVPIEAKDIPEPDKPEASGQNVSLDKIPKTTVNKPSGDSTIPVSAAAPVQQPAASQTKDTSTQADAQPTTETKKAVEEAAIAAQRERELEDYIDSRKFFVPINAVARKRSIKVSIVLTGMVLLLAIVLIDLMLDSGIILLVQKIPHTHFFSLNSSNN